MARLFLRIAASLAFVQGLGHGLLVLRWTPVRGADEVAVTTAMRAQHFQFQGFSRSYWDFFIGYGLLAAFNCLVEAVLFWQLAALGDERVSTMVALFAVANVVYAALCWRFFFITPLVFDVAIAISLGLALLGRGTMA